MEPYEEAIQQPLPLHLPEMRPLVDQEDRESASALPELQATEVVHARKKRKAGYVYLMATTDMQVFKIGYTTNVHKRYFGNRSDALKLFGRPLRLVSVMKGGRDLEAELIQKYRYACIRGREWFRPASGMRGEWIKRGAIPIRQICNWFCRKHGVLDCTCAAHNNHMYREYGGYGPSPWKKPTKEAK